MGVGDILSGIGHGLEGVGKAAGRTVQEFGPEIGTALRGDAGQVAYEQRQHQYSQEEQEREIRANSLEQEIEIMRNVGPQQGQDPAQWEQAIAGKVRDLTGIYPKAQHAPQLMDRLKRIAHGKQGQQQPMNEQVPGVPGLTSTGYLPPQGLWQAQAEAKAVARPQNPKTQMLDTYSQQHFGVPFSQANAEQQNEAFHASDKQRLKSAIVEDDNSPTKFSWATWDVTTNETVSTFPGALPPRGLIPTHTVTRGTDIYGNPRTTVTERTPQLAGMTGQSAAAEQTTQTLESPSTPAAVLGKPKVTGKPKTSPKSTSTPAQALAPSERIVKGTNKLDANGQIPATAGGNPLVREFAQQLIDDRDVDKIPSQGRAAAASLARQYGWSQGKFTPKEQTMLREASTFIQDGLTNPALKALDSGWAARMGMSQAALSPDKEGFIGRGLSTAAAQHLSPEQAEFIRWYNQMVGTISGLAQLVRSGRATEATIERLKAELPNPVTTQSSADARKRLQRLQKELSVALEKGSFANTGVTNAAPSSTDSDSAAAEYMRKKGIGGANATTKP